MRKQFVVLIFTFIFTFGIVGQAYAQIANLRVVNKNSEGVVSNDTAGNSFVSENGNFIAFDSLASNLVEDDNNGAWDIFVYDVINDSIERVSLSDTGVEGDGDSMSPTISEDGRYVTFQSESTNLVDGDTNGAMDVFLYDRDSDTIELISFAVGGGISNSGSSYPHMSLDARYIGFTSDSTDIDLEGDSGIFVYDRDTEIMERVNVNSNEEIANNVSSSVSLSNDGRYVVFQSGGTNLSSGDNNTSDDVFIRDRLLGTTERVSVSSSEEEGDLGGFVNVQRTAVTEDGRYVLFGSSSTNLVDNDTNNLDDVFIRDRTLGVTTRINVSDTGDEANGNSVQGSLSTDGRYVVFRSEADNLTLDDNTSGFYDIFVKDLLLNTVKKITVSSEGAESNNDSEDSAGVFSGGGRFLSYISTATNLTDDILTPKTANIFYAEIKDEDGVDSEVEDAAPNNGDADENGYDDAIEENVTPFINSVTNNYSLVKTTGDCVRNDNPNAVSESSLDTQDPSYDYPLGIISFEVNCKDTGETATVSVFCFCENAPVEGTIARKYNEGTREYTTIEDAVIEEVTIDGQRALKMTYDVVDGGELDEDGLENGTIVDPVGFARVQESAPSSGGSSSSGSRASTNFLAQNNIVLPTTAPSENACTQSTFVTLMKKGSKFGEVLKLQEALNTLGFNSGIPDGLFGPMTDMAVKAFQSANTLDADGIVGPMTREGLNGKCL